jgi:hypothetical protein
MSANINELAQAAIDALAAINAIHKDWIEQLKLNISNGQDISTRPEIADHLHIELLEAITDFDCDPMETLAEFEMHFLARFEMQVLDESDVYDGGRFDYLTSRGVK